MKALSLIMLMLLMACHSKENLATKSEVLLEPLFDAAGGYNDWTKITELSFLKESNLYQQDSSLESSVLQRQTFRNYPEFYGEIEYLNDSLNRRIIQENNQVKYYENDVIVVDEKKIRSAETNIRTAFYVISLPFKLNDPGVQIQSLKEKDLLELHVKHESKPAENWWLYFYPNNRWLQGYLIEHENRFSHIINDSITEVNGFTFPVLRRSILSDSNNENPYFRADYQYSNIKIIVDEN
ncbi:hypothetical protein [Portibacter marinus]|uniref:hypothetical protein n=1 Tax=Portibacter marinus TaxID=2898660 RepID=UPI001F35AE5D|nr:hypothetical protein [Portibacter marinus]